MRTTTIKVWVDSKEAFDRLQARAQQELDRKVNHQLLFDWMVDFTLERWSEFFQDEEDSPLTDDDVKYLESLIGDYGGKERTESIDEIIAREVSR